MEIILWIIFGAVVGWVASLIMKTGEQGVILNVVVGAIGAVLGGLLMGFVGEAGVAGLNLYSFFVALLGACVLIFVLRAVRP